MDPGADGGNTAVEHVATREELQLGAVIVVGGPHRADHRHVVDQFTSVRPPVADLDSALAALPVPLLQRQDAGLVGLDDVVENLFLDVAVIFRFGHMVEEGCFGQGLAGVSIECRRGIESLVVTRPAAHHQPDHRLGPRCEVRTSRRVGSVWRGPCFALQVTADHRVQRDTGQAHAAPTQQLAPGCLTRECCHWERTFQRMTRKSLCMTRTCATCPCAFRRAAVASSPCLTSWPARVSHALMVIDCSLVEGARPRIVS